VGRKNPRGAIPKTINKIPYNDSRVPNSVSTPKMRRTKKERLKIPAHNHIHQYSDLLDRPVNLT
jgi:hypothetical protein